ncbi:PREDICTED: influenza virus NS1A-binding protein-like isoform X2 [Nicrophorus vespilloides]|nr:PREDICTED: influenza virus NS1A-binding protein-like isoform X2 [Nicrophorus vespilloides]
MNGIEMEEEEETFPLIFTDDKLQDNTLSALNMMRKNRHFCDVILHVGNVEIHAHRAILASVSPYLFELFSNEVEQKSTENVVSYKLNGGFDKRALQILIEYAYTASLEVPFDQVKAVYLAACHLKIERVARCCAQHLIKHLSVDNCIETRSLPGIARNKELTQKVDSFIANEFDGITGSPSLLNLSCARIEILNQSRQEMSHVNHSSLCRLVLDWIRKQLNENSLTHFSLNERTHMLYLAIDNSLQDCTSLPTGDICDTDIVQDYKKMSLKNVTGNSKAKRKSLVQPSKPRVLIYSREIGEDLEAEAEPDWNLIASSRVGEHCFLALVTLAGKLCTLSVQLRLNMPTTPSPIATPDVSRPSSEEKPDLYCALANMSNPRCAVGCGNLNNNLIVCGGYDRIECLKTAELYNPDSNTWTALPQLKESRGRFQIAVLDDKVYAIGGSNGTTELETVEMLDMNLGKWTSQPRLPLARSNPGVCDLNGIIYCVGGWNGQVGIKQCDVFDPKTQKWTSIAPLNIGRYQAGLTAYGNQVYAIGGCDSWNCLSSVEVYNPEDDVWVMIKSIITARRGCGVAVFNNRLYVVGGSDGSHSLSSTEIYDAKQQTWVVGPSMTTPRANVEVAVVGNRLYAVGGFSGKTFLNTIEYLDENSNEWTTFVQKGFCRSRTSSRQSFSESNPVIDSIINGTIVTH